MAFHKLGKKRVINHAVRVLIKYSYKDQMAFNVLHIVLTHYSLLLARKLFYHTK